MATFRAVLVADDEASIRHVLSLVLSEHGYEVRAVADGEEALKELGARHYDVVISDVRMPKVDGLNLLKTALASHPDLTFLVMSAYGSKDQALEAVAAGAYDFIQKPFKPEEIVFVLKKAEERQRLVRENRRLRGQPETASPLDRLLGESEAMASLKRQLTRVAPVSTTVLVAGESGTGKELVARAIHELSLRAQEPFITVNCGAIPAGLIESELFGHARGAFTDARQARRGLFSEADGGTIFLDEVGELPMAAQVKLLRVLQEGEVRPVGESRAEKVDVRVVAATLRDLSRLVEKGEFREDLYFRLNVVQLKVPPLRERKGDVLPLATAFLERFNREFNREPPLERFGPEAEALLTAYAWPGNVRELENAVERAVLLADGRVVVPENLPEKLWSARLSATAQPQPAGLELPRPEAVQFSLKRAIHEVEERFIRAALRRTRGNRTRAAELLEISHRALLYKLKDYGIDADAEGEKGPGEG
ncbi:MAG: sigma-54-dependent Fis family transcriptional regulator [Myxococcales bacterium]|nr:sigma-54-dependent Fis family transcriptional regulator [Myxococcales bacterium]